MIALEMYTRKRFDYPICVEGGVRAAYNRELNLAILCDEPRKMDEQRAIIARMPAIKIICIDANMIYTLWNEKNDNIYGALFDRVIYPLNKYIFDCAHIDLDIVTPTDSARVRAILESWRILTKYAHDDGNVLLSTMHPICKKSIKYEYAEELNRIARNRGRDHSYDSYSQKICALDRAAYMITLCDQLKIIRDTNVRDHYARYKTTETDYKYRATISDAQRSASQLPRQ
jgi:hypothetical protein